MRIYIPIIIIFLGLACSKKTSTPLSHEGARLEFGNGGGFTGTFSSIYLLDNGEVFSRESRAEEFVRLGKLSRDITKQVFTNYQKLGLSSMSLDEPGNRYYFISYLKENTSHKIQWGNQPLDNPNPQILHKLVMDLVKKLESKN
ncbi:MAG: hypothetical protein IPN29_08395 [Saprospiraceae bacterium]|nr:hypothetical protein [Saprospiraceae bacterium]